MKTCSIEGCEQRHYAKALCRKHWRRDRVARRVPEYTRRLALQHEQYHGRPQLREALLAKNAERNRRRYAKDADYRAAQRTAADAWAVANRGRQLAIRRAAEATRTNRKRLVDPAGIRAAIAGGMVDQPCANPECRAPGPSEIDHIIPLSWADGCPAVAGVLGQAWAYQPLCKACNGPGGKGAHYLAAYVPTGDIGDQ